MKLSPKQRVLAKYPKARLEESAMWGWRVVIDRIDRLVITDWHVTQAHAWAAAGAYRVLDRKLEAEKKETARYHELLEAAALIQANFTLGELE